MHIYRYQLRFQTPAFLGNANQQAQWRTPPIKALLRQWWRVACAAEKPFAVDAAVMRREEALLFGHAWLEDDVVQRNGRMEKTAARQSLLRLRLSHWNEGKLKSWDGLEQGSVHHPETEKTGYKVGPHAYLGYGPLDGRGGTKFAKKDNAAIQAGDSATLSLAVPDQHAGAIGTALALMNLYGTLGGRSRNGWGSFSLTPADEHTPVLPNPLQGALLQPWQDALRLDWPHAIGSDAQGPLIWQTRPFADWPQLMQEMARLKIGLRTQLIFTTGKDSPRTEERHWLSYPVTNHSVKAWGGNARLPNSLRFKVRPAPGDAQKVIGVVFHVPCQPPPAFQPEPHTLRRRGNRSTPSWTTPLNSSPASLPETRHDH